MQVSVLIENHPGTENMNYEHGLSLLLEDGSLNLLLDAGQTEGFFANAQQMNVDLAKVDVAVLSHGHYDHAGGFAKFFQHNTKAALYAHSKVLQKYYSLSGGLHEIGVQEEVLQCADRFSLGDTVKQLAPHIYLVPHTTSGLEAIGKKAGLYKAAGSDVVPDDFQHEQSLVYVLPQGLAIFNSCSHAGVLNIAREVKAALAQYGIEQHIYAYIGGLHMKGSCNGQEICTFSDKQLDEVADFIKAEGMQLVYSGHCTGDVAYNELKQRLGDVLQQMYTGLTFEL